MLGLPRFQRIFFVCFIINVVQSDDGYKLSKSIASWSTNVLQDNVAVSTLSEMEPGFDLNEEDMSKFHIWPSGTIPYYIDDFSFDKVLKDRIRSFLEHTNVVTGLHFMELPRPPFSDTDRYVLFINRQGFLGCSDYPFSYYTNSGVQRVVLGYNCLNAGRQLAPLVLSLVGVPPQHNAPDRNKTIKIDWNKILPGKREFFEELPDDEWLFHDVPYDLQSAGHYSLYKYTANGHRTLVPLVDSRMVWVYNSVHYKMFCTGQRLSGPLADASGMIIGDGDRFSYTDIWKMQMLYNYIGKNKVSEVKASGCKKLFSRGSNFSNYQIESDDELQPRKKPSQYSNTSDEISDKKGSTAASHNNITSTRKYELFGKAFTYIG